MATNFPTSIQTLSGTRGTDGQPLNAPNHVTHHTTEDDTIVALETKVGADSSADTASHDYKLSEVLTATPDKAVGKAAIQTLTNKTLTSPKITAGAMSKGDMLQLSASDGTLTPLRASAQGNIPSWNATSEQWEAIANPAAADATYAVKGVRVLDANAVYYAADAGSTDAYAITLSPAPSAYAAGQTFRFKANTINTGAATLNVNSLGAKTIVKGVNTTLADGDIPAGQFCTVTYDGTNFVLQNPVSTAISIPDSTSGVSAGPASSSTQTITHGLGRVPKKIRLSGIGLAEGSASSTYYSSSFGTYNSTGNRCVYIDTTAPSAGGAPANSTVFAIYLGETSANYATGVVGNINATTFDIVWTNTGGTAATCQFIWEAE